MRIAFGMALTFLLLLADAPEAAAIESTSGPMVSRCAGHVAEVVRGAVRLDGKSLPSEGELVVAPVWRRDCSAVAWVEVKGTERRLVVVPSLHTDAQQLSWVLPPTLGDERIFWVGRRRVAVGVAMLRPRAMASWS